MNDLFLSDVHISIRDAVRIFAQKELTEKIVREYEEGRVYARRSCPKTTILTAQSSTPLDLYRKIAELGFLGTAIPAAYGGLETNDALAQVVVMEELSYAWPGFALGCFAVPCSLFASPVIMFGTEEQKSKYLSGIAEGREFGAFALTEPEAGSWAANQKTKAVKTTKGTWTLNGQKEFITDATLARAIIVFARTEPGTDGTSKGISAFLVEKRTKGMTVMERDKRGQHAAPFATIYFNDCEMPAKAILGQEGQGYEIAMKTLAGGRVLIAAQGLGIARRAFDIANDYAGKRETFHKKLNQHQLVQGKLADMRVAVETMRLLTYRAAFFKDSGKTFETVASMAKLATSEGAVKVVYDALQILGGFAYTTDCPLVRMLNDAIVLPIYEGASDIQRVKIASAV